MNKIQRFKNPILDINENKLNENSKYKIFLSKTQFNNLLDQGFIKYKLTDSKKRMNIQKGDRIGNLLSMAFNMIKPALPKIATTIGLSGLSAGVSHGINKALNKKKKILEIDEKMMNQIKQNLKKINNIFIFDSFGIGDIPNNLYKIYKNYNIITNIYRIQDIDSNLCGMFCVLFCLYEVDSKNKFISFLNLFNSNNFLKNELI